MEQHQISLLIQFNPNLSRKRRSENAAKKRFASDVKGSFNSLRRIKKYVLIVGGRKDIYIKIIRLRNR